ncbi:MAG: hypothetical protein ACRCYX_12895 [Dermatophilaceae bacterium]
MTGVVYPALDDLPDERWEAGQEQHRRRIAPVVLIVYGALLGAAAWRTVAGHLTSGTYACFAGIALALAVTAFSAAPTHGKLGASRTPQLMRRLLMADQIRLAAALLAVLGAASAL